jgi:hypothetical protein
MVELRYHRGYVAADVLVGQRPRKDAAAALNQKEAGAGPGEII